MRRIKNQRLRVAIFGAALAALLTVSLACTARETATSVPPPASPAPVVAPTVAPTPVPTPTKALPTPTLVATGKPLYGGTLRFATRMEIDTMDPSFNALPGGYSVFYAVYDQLFRIDQTGNLLPSLAQSWDFSPDGKTITLPLRKGVKFHDGTPFNAQVVKWNFDRMMDPTQNSPRRGELQPYIERVEVLDESTLKLQLYRPFRPLLPLLGTERVGWLVSPAAVEKYGGGREGGYGKNPVGTGPFRFVEWVPQDRLMIRRNDGYWEQGKPYLDAVLMQAIQEPGVRVAMLRTGETDMVYSTDVRVEDVPIVERNQELKVVWYEGAATSMLHFNPSKPPFNSKALRQAVAYAMDKTKLIKAVYGGVRTPAYTMIATGWAYNPNLKTVEFDLAKAKEKLGEAGYPKGVTVPIGCPTAGIHLQVCEATQALLAEAGIKVEIQLMHPSGYFSMIDTGYFNKVGFGSIQWAHRIDPHTILQAMFHTKGFNNLGAYNNPEVDRLIDEAAAIYDPAKAKPLYDRIQTIVAEDAVVAFLSRAEALYPMNKRAQGFITYPTKFEHLELLWLEK